MPRDALPAYCRHKRTGLAYVTLNGREIYLGPWSDDRKATSRREYDRIIQKWLANGRNLDAEIHEPQAPRRLRHVLLDDEGIGVADLAKRFWDGYVKVHYRRDGRATREQTHFKLILRRLRLRYGDKPAARFGPLALQDLREEMIKEGLSRKYINSHVDRIRRVFRWGVARQLVHSEVYESLKAVEGLRKGRTEAIEGRPVRPVPETYIDATRLLVAREVAAMIDLQLLTGMRPGEVCSMRGQDLEMDGDCWMYVPAHHKTEHHGKERRIHIGPKAQVILKHFLGPDLTAPLFSPRHAERARSERRRAHRRTPLSPSQARRRRKLDRARAPGDVYTVEAYRRAIARACERAWPPPGPLARRSGETPRAHRERLTPQQQDELTAWRRDHSWHPHQLRHNAATRLRKEFGIEVARVILGHTSALVTEIYAERDLAVAREIMSRVG